MQRVLTYALTRGGSKRDFDLLRELCHNSKNLYNYANYIVRQAFTGRHENIPEFQDLITNGKFVSEFALSGRLEKMKQSDFVSLKAQCSQQVLKQVFRDWKSFFRAMREYRKDKSKFLGKPGLPKYKDKNGVNLLVFTNQSCSFDKVTRRLQVAKNRFIDSVVLPECIDNFQQVRVVPRGGYFQIEVVYNKGESEYTREAKEKNRKLYHAGVDIGVGTLAAVTSDRPGVRPLLVSGGHLKSTNQFYNKKLAELQSIYARQGIKSGRKARKLGFRRRCLIEDYFHKMSRHLVDWCVENDIGTVFVGHNVGWKQECDMHSKVSTQNFVQIPFNRFIHMLRYKLEEVGVELVEQQEAYTSKCSALDGEAVRAHEKYAGYRAKRGLFKTAKPNRRRVNADVNGSLNIMRLGLGRDFEIGDAVFNPYRTNALRDAPHGEPADRGLVVSPGGAPRRRRIPVKTE